MRVALIQKKVRWAGQPNHVLALALGLRDRGHEVFLVSQPGSEFSGRAGAAGFGVFELPLTTPRASSTLAVQARAAIRLVRFLRRNRIEILHCHDSRDHQIACVVGPLARVPVIRTKHNTIPLRNAASRWVHGVRTAHLIAVSEAVRHGLIEDGMDEQHVTTVHGFVDPERFRLRPPDPELRRALGIPAGAPIVGTLGRLHRKKGIGDLVRAMPEILAGAPEARFLLVGGSHLWWPPMVKELGIEDRCVFTDRVSNVADYLALMDVAVFPSLREAFGLSILEAMCTGRAVVATRVGGIPELVRHGTNGLLVEPERPDQIARAVLRLLRDGELRRALSAEGRRTGTRVFTRDRCLDGTETVYRRVRGG